VGERTLLRAAQQGDHGAFAELVRLHDRAFRALAHRLLNDRDAIDDVLQEAYVKAFVALRRFRGDSSVRTWLYRIVYNACLDELKRRPQPRDEPDAEIADWGADPSDVVPERARLAAALAALAPTERTVVLLVDAEGLSYEEAAAVTGVPGGTIASRLSRARAALRRALRDPQGVSP
jgi:RNA polymerase sigma-70 factor (ECF subfamily)